MEVRPVMETMDLIHGMSRLPSSISRKEHNVRMIEIDEKTGEWTSYLRTKSHQIIIQENMMWSNGTQYICNI